MYLKQFRVHVKIYFLQLKRYVFFLYISFDILKWKSAIHHGTYWKVTAYKGLKDNKQCTLVSLIRVNRCKCKRKMLINEQI